jgi:hypothetical protein
MVEAIAQCLTAEVGHNRKGAVQNLQRSLL